MGYYIVSGQLVEVDDPESMAQLQAEGIKPLNPQDFNDQLKVQAIQNRERLATRGKLYVNGQGQEETVPLADVTSPGGEDRLKARGLTEKHSALGAFARGFLDKALFGGGEEVAAGLMSLGKGNSYGKEYEGLVKNRRESVGESPRAGGIGQIAGATVGSPVPAGKALMAGKTLLGTAGRLGAAGTAASFAGGSLGTEGTVSERLKSGVEAAKVGGPLSFALGLPLAPLSRKLPETVDALDDPSFGLLNPSTFRDPRVLRNQASAARLSSMRGTPASMYEAAGKTGFVRAGESPAEAILRFGDELNGLTSIEPSAPKSWWERLKTMGGKEQPILDKNSTAPRMERSLFREGRKSGELIDAAEQAAARRGANIDLREYFPKVGNIGGKLDASRPKTPLTPVLMEEVERKVAPPKETVLPFPGKMVEKQVPGTKPTGLTDYRLSDPKAVQAPGIPVEGEYAPLSGVSRGTVTTPGGPVLGRSPRLAEGPSPGADVPFPQRAADFRGRGVSVRAGQTPPPLRSTLNHPEAAWDKDPVDIASLIEKNGVQLQTPSLGRQASYPGTPVTRLTEPQPWWNTPRQEFVREAVPVGPASRPAYVGTKVREQPPMTEVQPYTLTPPDASEAVRRLRAVAAEDNAGFRASGVNRVSGDYPGAIDQSAGVLAGMKNTAVDATLDPFELAATERARRNYALTSTADEIINGMKQAVQAPYTIGSEIQGSIGQSIAASAGLGPAAQVGAARLGRLLSRVRNVNPSKASRDYGLARALEGDPLTLGGYAAGKAVRGAERLPLTLEKGFGITGGDDLTDEDPDSLSLRRIIAQRLAQRNPSKP